MSLNRTPAELKIKRCVIPPPGGWNPNTYYIVDVAFNSSNPIHRAIFYTGFLSKGGHPQGYNSFVTSDNAEISDAYYVKALAELNINELSFRLLG